MVETVVCEEAFSASTSGMNAAEPKCAWLNESLAKKAIKSSGVFWFRDMDSNHDYYSQSVMSYPLDDLRKVGGPFNERPTSHAIKLASHDMRFDAHRTMNHGPRPTQSIRLAADIQSNGAVRLTQYSYSNAT